VAVNAFGNSTASTTVALKAAQVPDTPAASVKSEADQTSISITWSAPAYDGSSSLIGYKIFWDNNTGTIITASPIGTTPYQTLSFTKSGLTAGLYYKFAVSAINDLGESLKSNSVTIIAATVPNQVSTPSLYSQSKTSIGISWTDPLENGGTPITNYLVQMDGGSAARNVFTTIATLSDQAADLYVTSPLTTSLTTGEIYNFRVIATNVVGNSTPSATLSAMAAIKPSAPGAPTKISATVN
jgi:hypothetical protein